MKLVTASTSIASDALAGNGSRISGKMYDTGPGIHAELSRQSVCAVILTTLVRQGSSCLLYKLQLEEGL